MARPKPDTILAFLEKSLQPSAGGGGAEGDSRWAGAEPDTPAASCIFSPSPPCSLSSLALPLCPPWLLTQYNQGRFLVFPTASLGFRVLCLPSQRHPDTCLPSPRSVPRSLPLSLSILTEHSPVTAVWWVRGGGKSRRWGQATTSGQFSDAQPGRRGDGCRM